MEISMRLPKQRRFGTPKKNKRQKYCGFIPKDGELFYSELEYLPHSKLRELQRYGTLLVKQRDAIKDICIGNAVIINQDGTIITALIRQSCKYYVAICDMEMQIIKTFLPDTIPHFLDYVQRYIDNEADKKLIAA